MNKNLFPFRNIHCCCKTFFVIPIMRAGSIQTEICITTYTIIIYKHGMYVKVLRIFPLGDRKATLPCLLHIATFILHDSNLR